MTTTIQFPISRIEGHAKVVVDIDNGKVRNARFLAQEYRGFEQFLQGMPADQMPVIVPRVCGVCSTSHHIAAVEALEDAYGVTPPPIAEKIRHLMMVGQLVQNQATSLFFFTMPDKLQATSIFGAEERAGKDTLGSISKKAMAVRKIGTELISVAGGQFIHPVKAVVGGVVSGIEKEAAKEMRAKIKVALPLACSLFDEYWQLTQKMAESVGKWEGNDPFYYMVAVDKNDPTLPVDTVTMQKNDGSETISFKPSEFKEFLKFHRVQDSYSSKTSFNDLPIRANSLARMNLAESTGTPIADGYLERFRVEFGSPAHQILLFDLCRGIELINGLERADRLLAEDLSEGEMNVPVEPRDGCGFGLVEAPRGPLIHHYQIENGLIVRAEFVIPTVHNNFSIERALTTMAKQYVHEDRIDLGLDRAMGWVVRAFDPCIACATH
ncbi:Ni/Fe hydrogenase subunit alpha [Desulfosediminicola flagellatus]|uniref:Ni/Fe hydrogenase subunit alpha n=1 Tax=Desulfosediminicola flagellatus TaxID=2569541 RepID=UPI0010AC5921|nr:Ni/Fe hydrogenase subunit alpha [Desulfosediminicola flagellatus]